MTTAAGSKSFVMPNATDWARISIYGALLALVYYSTFEWLITHDWIREDYNYAYLIPFVVLYLIWEKREALFTETSSPSWSGLAPILMGFCLFWLGELSGEFFTQYISFWLFLFGLCWINLGWEKLKTILFPLVIVLTMFPLPNFLNTKITGKLQLISSQLGVLMIQMFGMTAYREGNVIDLGFTQLQVVEACSGLRYVIPLFVLGLLMAYIFKAAVWKRIFLLLSTIPLSIFVNSFRIAITGVLYKHFGAEVAEGFFHGFSGWLIFMFTIPILLVEMWVLRRIPPREGREVRGRKSDIRTTNSKFEARNSKQIPMTQIRMTETGRRQEGRSGFATLWSPYFLVPVVLLGATLALSQGVEFREKIPMSRPLSQFPLQIGGWSGSGQFMEQKFIDELDLTDYTIVDYKDRKGNYVNFYAAYYESQSKGESIHSPETCLPGAGWVFEDAGQAVIPVAGYAPGEFKVKRAYMKKGAYRQLSYFWFPQRGRILTNAWQLKAYTFWDALTKQRTDGALVRLITPVGEYEKLEEAEERLQAFTRQIVPVLDGFIPGKDLKGGNVYRIEAKQ